MLWLGCCCGLGGYETRGCAVVAQPLVEVVSCCLVFGFLVVVYVAFVADDFAHFLAEHDVLCEEVVNRLLVERVHRALEVEREP